MGEVNTQDGVRLIDANVLEKHLINIANILQDAGFASYAGAMGEAAAIVHNRPSVAAVEVVRCKDCVYRGNELKCPMRFSEYFDSFETDYGMDCTVTDNTTDDGFCHKGAKMDKEEG